ncbi:MAG: SurA N-terminal domain-containing protein [Pseudomonadota bacterium]
MLDALRKSVGGWVAKAFIGLLVLSFAVWGIADMVTGGNQRAVALVGDVEISPFRFRDSFQRQVQQLSQRLGRVVTAQEAQTLGIDQQVLSQLVSEAALTQAAIEKGLAVSEEQLAQDIVNEPSFRSATGGFSRAAFNGFLQQVGMSEEQYLIERANISRRYQVAEAIAGDTTLPNTLLEALHRYQAEERTARYVVLSAGDVETPADPGDETLQPYFEANLSRYRAPEYRRINILTVDPSAMAMTIELSDEDARAFYEERLNDYQSEERRVIRQIPFDTIEDANAAKEKLDAGATVDDIREERGLTEEDINLGTMTQGQMLDEEIAEVAFALDAGTPSDPIEARFRTVIVIVDEILEAGTTPFEEVEADVRVALSQERAIDRALDLYDLIEDDRAAGMTLKEISEERGVAYREVVPFDRTARTAEELIVSDLPVSQDLIRETFDAEEGLETDPLQIGTAGNVWFDLTEVIPSRDRTLDEVRAEVLSDWQSAQVQSLLDEAVEALEAQISAGATLDEVASKEGLILTRSTPVTRTEGSDDLSREAVAAIFARPVGQSFNAAHANQNDRVFGVVAGSDVPPYDTTSSTVAELEEQLTIGVEDDLLSQYISNIQDEYRATVNQNAIDIAIGVAVPEHGQY